MTIRGLAVYAVAAASLAAATQADAQSSAFSAAPVVFTGTDNTVQQQEVVITLTAASTVKQITIPLGFTADQPEFMLLDEGGCTEDGATVNPAGSVCRVMVKFRPARAGLRTASLVITDGNGNATAIGLAGTGYYPQVAVTPALAKIVAGLGPTSAGLSGDGDAAVLASLSGPTGVATDSFGNMYFADTGNNVVRMLDAFGNVTTVAGGGTVAGAAADGGSATLAQLQQPTYLAVDSAGNLYFSETGSHVVRKVTMSGTRTITTVAGSYVAGFSDGTSAVTAQLNHPQGIAVDAAGNLFVVDSGNQRVREVMLATGVITTVAGSGTKGTTLTTSAASSAVFSDPTGIAVVGSTIYVSDAGNHVVRSIAGGNVNVVVGTGNAGHSGDGGAATAATLGTPAGLAVSPAGDLYVVDAANGQVRKVQAADGVIETIAGEAKDAGAFSTGVAPALNLRMNAPLGLAMDGDGNLYIADSGNNVLRMWSTAPGEMQFPNLAGGNSSAPITLKIANIGNADLSVAGLAAADSATSSNYSFTNGAVVCGSVVAKGTHCEYSVVYSPQASGFNAGKLLLTHTANNTNFTTVEPIYLLGGLASTITIGPDTLSSVLMGQALSSATITATGGYGTLTVDSEGTLPAGVTASVSGATVTLSGTPTVSGDFTLTVFAVDTLGQEATKTYTLHVLPATLTVNIMEAVHVTDATQQAPGLSLAVVEAVHVTDAPALLPGKMLSLMEAVHVTDTTQQAPGLSLTVSEAVHVSDQIATSAAPIGQTITAPTFAGHTYGDAAFSVSATSSSGLPVAITVQSGPATISNGVLDMTGGGTVTVAFNQAGNANYSAAPTVTRSFSVAPAAATITAQNATRNFEAANPTFTFIAGGLVHGDTAATLGGAPALTTTAVLNSPAGTYPISAALGTLPVSNYTFTFTGATLTVVGHTAQTITFNAIPNVPLAVGKLTLTARSTSGLAITYNVTGPATLSKNQLTLTGTGTVTVTATQPGNLTFDAATPVTRSFTVTP